MTPLDQARLGDVLRAAATKAGLPCMVIFNRHRLPGDVGRYSSWKPRTAVAYIADQGPSATSSEMIGLIIDANQRAGHLFDAALIRNELSSAAYTILTEISAREGVTA